MKNKKKNNRIEEWFSSQLLALIIFIAILLYYNYLISKGDESILTERTILFFSIYQIFSFVLIKKELKSIYLTVKKAFTNKLKLNLEEYGNLFFVSSNILTIYCIFFVIEISSIDKMTFQLGTVVFIGLLRFLRVAFLKR